MALSNPSSRRRSRIAHFKAPFILSVAAPALLGVACGGQADVDPEGLAQAGAGGRQGMGCKGAAPNPTTATCGVSSECVNGTWVETITTCNPPPPPSCEGPPPLGNFQDGCGASSVCVDGVWKETFSVCNPPPPLSDVCPAEAPEAGSSCDAFRSGLNCPYDYCDGVLASSRVCDADTQRWQIVTELVCNPPPPACAPAMPVPGSDCFLEGTQCLYAGCQGAESDSAVCHFGQWAVTYSIGPACNPPSVVTPVCPAAEIVTGAPCWYEGQQCEGPSGCDGAPAHGGHTCSFGIWQESLFPCPQPASDAGSQDAGGADAGL